VSPDSIPQVSLGTAALIIFGMCAGFVILRGMTRLIIGTIVLSLSAWIGYQVWQEAPKLSMAWTGSYQPWIANGFPLVAFLVSFFIIRFIVKSIARPLGPAPDEKRPRSVMMISFLLLLALVPAALLWIVGATFVHHTGAIAEVRAYSEKNSGMKDTTPDGFISRLKTSVEAALPASWLKTLDPLSEPSRIAMVKLITLQADTPLKPVIDPRTGEPIPRAIVVNPDLQTLAREREFSTLLRHPLVTQALTDPRIRKLLHDLSL
jgi:hypothetical protein